MSDFTQQGPGSGGQPEQFEGSGQGQGAGYDQASQSSNDDGMGGGAGAQGSGVAGGYGGSQQQSGEKQDWLDKGIEAAGQKAGFNVSNANADKIGDFANKQFDERAGRNLPGVQ